MKLSFKHVGIFLIIMSLGLIFTGCAENNVTVEEIRNSMNDYLENVYEKEFIVEQVYSTGLTFFAAAYPMDNPDIRFEVQRYKGDEHLFKDNYNHARMSYEGKKEIKPFLDSLFQQDVRLTLNVFSIHDQYADLSYSQLMSKYPENIKIELTCYIFVKEFNAENEARHIQTFLNQYLKEKGVENHLVLVFFIDPQYRKEFDRISADPEVFNAEWDPERLRAQGVVFSSLSLIDQRNTDIESIKKMFR